MPKYLDKSEIKPINKDIVITDNDAGLPEWYFKKLFRALQKTKLQKLKTRYPEGC